MDKQKKEMQNIISSLKTKFQDNVTVESIGNSINIQTSKENFYSLVKYLADEKIAPYFSFLTAVDYSDRIDLIYYFYNIDQNMSIKIKTFTEKISPKIQSIALIYKGADYHEREVFDLFGVVFENHPNLKRLLTPDDFEGYPMRKDFTNDDLVVMK